jgi:hypothetical protein
MSSVFILTVDPSDVDPESPFDTNGIVGVFFTHDAAVSYKDTAVFGDEFTLKDAKITKWGVEGGDDEPEGRIAPFHESE